MKYSETGTDLDRGEYKPTLSPDLDQMSGVYYC